MIALISQYYEDVMNSKVMHTYIMKNDLNQEYNIFNEFMKMLGLRTDEIMDAIVLIDGEFVENETEWKGLTQTVKKLFTKEI